jgi:hypothetical protein
MRRPRPFTMHSERACRRHSSTCPQKKTTSERGDCIFHRIGRTRSQSCRCISEFDPVNLMGVGALDGSGFGYPVFPGVPRCFLACVRHDLLVPRQLARHRAGLPLPGSTAMAFEPCPGQETARCPRPPAFSEFAMHGEAPRTARTTTSLGRSAWHRKRPRASPGGNPSRAGPSC